MSESLKKRMGDAPYKIVQGRRRFEDGLNCGSYGAQIAFGKIEFSRGHQMEGRRKQAGPFRAPYYLRKFTHILGRQTEESGETDCTIATESKVSRSHAKIDLDKEGSGFQMTVSITM